MNDQVPVQGKPRTGVVGAFVALIVAELLLLFSWWYTSYYWKLPIAAIAIMAVLGVAVIGLFALVVSKAKRKLVGLLVTVALVVVVAVLFMVASLFFPGSLLPREGRIRQISDEAKITVLLPADRQIEAHDRWGYEPSSTLSEEGVFTIDYREFALSERASDAVLTAAQLEDYVDLEEPEAGSDTALDVGEAEELTVLGRPAVAVTASEVIKGKGAQQPTTILVFQPDGLVARIASASESGMSTADLVTIAESLEALK